MLINRTRFYSFPSLPPGLFRVLVPTPGFCPTAPPRVTILQCFAARLSYLTSITARPLLSPTMDGRPRTSVAC